MALVVAQFIRCYGAAAFLNEAYETEDHVIPWGEFWVLYAQISPVYAQERIGLALGTSHGIGIVFGGDAVKPVNERALREAFPES